MAKPIRIRVDLRSKVPAYRQIVEQVQALVGSGAVAAGDQLPTIRSLAAEAHINFNTVARAYRLLDQAGVISTQHGRGTYVVAGSSSGRAAQAGKIRTVALESLTRDYLRAARRIGAAPKEVRSSVDRELRRAAAQNAGGVGRRR